MQQHSNPDPRLEARLNRLERQNRRMRWAYVVLLGALLGSCAKQPKVPLEIVAREFKVMDDEGHVYASLGIAPWNPEGVLVLQDRLSEERRGSLGPAKLALGGGATSVQLEAGDVSMLVMHDRAGWNGAKLSLHPTDRKSALWLTGGTTSIYRNP